MKHFVSGKYIYTGTHKAFFPENINRKWIFDDNELLNLLSKADRSLGRLDMFSKYVDIDLYIRTHIAKEATQSSRIEGTQTQMEEVFMPGEDFSGEKRNDWLEVQNYIEAINKAVIQLNQLPFSSRLIKQAHRIITQGVRGKHKQPGEFRKTQNWIGGATIADAVFVPPPPTEIPGLMSDLEKFAHDTENPIPDLLKIGIIHYQFETIHPFLDGNGRVGRLLITLYLVSRGLLQRPILYISDFFERHRNLYYDKLMLVRTHNDIGQWLKFFLTGIIETSEKGIKTFDGILQLQKEIDIRLKTLKSREGNARKLIEYLYRQPVLIPVRAAGEIGLSMATVYKLIADLENLGLIGEITGGKRGRIYVFKKYLQLFE